MKKEWSTKWKGSVQPRKQRKFRANAPLSVRRKFLSAHLTPSLRERYGTRSVVLRKGDQIQVMRGSSKGTKGSVERVDTKTGRIYMDALKVKKADGSEVMKPVVASNVMVTSLVMEDKKRAKSIERKGGKKISIEPKKEQIKEEKPAKKAPA